MILVRTYNNIYGEESETSGRNHMPSGGTLHGGSLMEEEGICLLGTVPYVLLSWLAGTGIAPYRYDNIAGASWEGGGGGGGDRYRQQII